jgi:hypothetical protein
VIFFKEFLAYFNHPELDEAQKYIFHEKTNPDVVREEKRKPIKDIMLFLPEAPSTRNREVVALRILLNCIESFNCERNVRKFFVTREGYSKGHKLIKHLLYNGKSLHDYWTPLKHLKDLTLDRRYWFGIISDRQAVREISKITMGKKESIPYIAYCPAYHNENGDWRIIFKYPRDSRFYAKNLDTGNRLHTTRNYSALDFVNYMDIIAEELEIVKEMCPILPTKVEDEKDSKTHDKEKIPKIKRRWNIPEEDEMKISFHTPGALTYLREAKVAYVYTDETPKEMMKRVKKEAREAAKKEQEDKKNKKLERKKAREDEELRREKEKAEKRAKKEQSKAQGENKPDENPGNVDFDTPIKQENIIDLGD